MPLTISEQQKIELEVAAGILLELQKQAKELRLREQALSPEMVDQYQKLDLADPAISVFPQAALISFRATAASTVEADNELIIKHATELNQAIAKTTGVADSGIVYAAYNEIPSAIRKQVLMHSAQTAEGIIAPVHYLAVKGFFKITKNLFAGFSDADVYDISNCRSFALGWKPSDYACEHQNPQLERYLSAKEQGNSKKKKPA
jgi:hypothetical protein